MDTGREKESQMLAKVLPRDSYPYGVRSTWKTHDWFERRHAEEEEMGQVSTEASSSLYP